MDAFHVRCLRRILKIPGSYYSRVTNDSVRLQAHAKAASNTLLERQLLWIGKLAIRRDDDVVRQSVFHSGANRLKPKLPMGRRKRGRPRACWAKSVHEHAVHAAGDTHALRSFWQDSPVRQATWAECVRQYCHD